MRDSCGENVRTWLINKRKVEKIMKKKNRIMMVQSMVNTLVDSIKDYENFESRNGYPPMYGNTEQYLYAIKRMLLRNSDQLFCCKATLEEGTLRAMQNLF